MAEQWKLVGDFLDFCRCRVPCACSFGRPPDDGECDGLLAFRFREGNYGEVKLGGLNMVGVGHFEGNIWDEDVQADMGMIVDERADDQQRQALQTIFGGEAGGWPQLFAENVVGEMLGMEFAAIELEIADDLSSWRLDIPGKAKGEAELLMGPTSAGEKHQVLNAPGAEVGPGQGPLTYGVSATNDADCFGLKWDWAGRSSKHIPFEWSSEDQF